MNEPNQPLKEYEVHSSLDDEDGSSTIPWRHKSLNEIFREAQREGLLAE
jgi:hypothetical protein